MNSRDKILSSLPAAEATSHSHNNWRYSHPRASLKDKFRLAFEKSHGELIEAEDLSGAFRILGDLLDDLNPSRVIANNEHPYITLDLSEKYPDFEWHICGKSKSDARTFAAGADIGLTGADAVLAETGSLALSSGSKKMRSASLLPPVHIVLVSTTKLKEDIFAWISEIEKPLPANLILVSGPSKTADIEQTLTVGVHGPKRVIVIMYSEN